MRECRVPVIAASWLRICVPNTDAQPLVVHVHDLELVAKVLNPEDMRNRVEYLPYS
jgi:hypothetical protein